MRVPKNSYFCATCKKPFLNPANLKKHVETQGLYCLVESINSSELSPINSSIGSMPKEDPKEDPKEGLKEDPKEDREKDPKEDQKRDQKENPKENPKEGPKEDPKVDPEENPKENNHEGNKQSYCSSTLKDNSSRSPRPFLKISFSCRSYRRS